MVLGALIDAGCLLETLQSAIATLSLPGVTLTAEKVTRHGLAATLARVHLEAGTQEEHRHLPDILGIIEAAQLEPCVKQNAKAIFNRLAEAEAHAHGIDINHVHFHEVGAADAIVDIVCACLGLEALGIERISSSPIPTGSGTITCAHGVMPVPAPATAHLLRGYPIAACEEPRELTTPTGAAILTTLAGEFGLMPEMKLAAIGCGAGTHEGQTRPNLLRLFLGETARPDDAEHDVVTVLQTQVDDTSGQVLAHACTRLLEEGALDAYLLPILMKKGRLGQLLTVLCRPPDAGALAALILQETSTFGVRQYEARRTKLARRSVTVATRFGDVRLKLGRLGEKNIRAQPEYEDCAAAARRTGVSLQEVQQEALQVWSRQHDDA